MTRTAIAILVIFSGFASRTPGQPVDPEEYRPRYHLDMPGDPSGCIRFNNEYHLFTWDHVVSSDLVHWTPRGWPMQNGPANIGYWTGSVVVDKLTTSGWGTTSSPAMVAVYAAHDNNDPKEDIRISVSTDYQNFLYYGGNPVVNTPDILFRDPHVFWDEQTDRWIMVVARSIEKTLRFYASTDLKNWTQLSEFGPRGGRSQIWEVPGLHKVPVEGTDTSRWVLFCGMGPNREQYFVGDFDGTTFTPDASMEGFLGAGVGLEGDLIEDFEEATYAEAGWSVVGNAFGTGPAGGGGGQPVSGYIGARAANSYVDGDWRVGSNLTSPPFTITRKFINFLVGGGDHPGQTCVNLLINGLVVRTATGEDSNIMKGNSWDVAQFIGQTNAAQIQIVDTYGGFWGRIYVDHLMQSDVSLDQNQEFSRWVDWGSDFYGARIFQDYDGVGGKPVWMGWFGNWDYATNVPTPWHGGGGQTVPRSLHLAPAPGGYELIQQPIEALKSLRGMPVHVSPRKVENATYLGEFHPTVNSYELEATFNLHSANQHFGLNLCAGSASTNGFQKVIVGYDAFTGNIYLDRRFSGDVSFHPNFANIVTAPFRPSEGYVKFQIFVDKSTIEVFVNDGKRVFTSLIFPHPENRAIELFSTGGPTTLRSMTAWPMSPR